MTDSAIRHLATSWMGKVFAGAKFKSSISIWNLENQSKTSEFESVLDFGGVRLAVDESGERCIAGAYQRRGIYCYDTQDGAVLWDRSDLKRVQSIRVLPSQTEVACGFDHISLHILSIQTGKTLQVIRGCRELFVSPFEPVQISDKRRPELQTLDGYTIAKLNRESFAIRPVSFGPGSVLVSEAAGTTRCFDTRDGNLLWRYPDAQRGHALEPSAYNKEIGRYVAVDWPHEKEVVKTLVVLDPETGAIERRFPIGSSIVENFCLGGTRLLSSSGWLLDTANGQVVGNFDFPLTEYPSN